MKITTNKDNSYSEMNSLVNQELENPDRVISENIIIIPLDTFCYFNTINKIDYLEIDTEGFDLEVLKGSVKMLENHLVVFIEVEVNMNPDNQYHVNFEKIKNFLEKYDYRVYGIYDQTHEWIKNEPVLKRVNPVFVSKSAIKRRLYDTKSEIAIDTLALNFKPSNIKQPYQS